MTRRQPEVFEVEVGGEVLTVLVVPAPPLEGDARLTVAERAVLAEILAGRSNREIALRRGRAVRTIANQLASIYRKLGVTSRSELVARLLDR
jgi:DNA-binding CsgD family transcriptional regulator